MPLDGHSYLIAQGWAGSGSGLRQGAISRPLAIPQKKNLSGLGKDRDEAFPFWDHVFSAAAKSIQLKVMSDDESDTGSCEPRLARTTTGILSNRRPVTGLLPTESSTTTPDADDVLPPYNLLSLAKRQAAKSSLYARFFRGPVLGPDDASPFDRTQEAAVIEVTTIQTTHDDPTETGSQSPDNQIRVKSDKASSKKRPAGIQISVDKPKHSERKKRKLREDEEKRKRERKAIREARGEITEKELERRRRKRLKRELKEKSREECQLDGGLGPPSKNKIRDKSDKGKSKESRKNGHSVDLPSASPGKDAGFDGQELVGIREAEPTKKKKRKRRGE